MGRDENQFLSFSTNFNPNSAVGFEKVAIAKKVFSSSEL